MDTKEMDDLIVKMWKEDWLDMYRYAGHNCHECGYLLEEGICDPVPESIKPKKCDCGANKANTTHAHWCQSGKGNK